MLLKGAVKQSYREAIGPILQIISTSEILHRVCVKRQMRTSVTILSSFTRVTMADLNSQANDLTVR